MKKINLNIFFFLSVLFLLSVFNILNAPVQITSELENRALHSKPEFSLQGVFSGVYFKEYEDYYSDNFVLRDKLVRISKEVKGLWAIGNRDGVEIVQHQGANIAQVQNEKEGAVEAQGNSEVKGVINEKVDKDTAVGYPAKDSMPGLREEGRTQAPIQETPMNSPASVEKDTGAQIGSMLVVNDKAMEISHFNGEACKFYADTINHFQEKLEPGTKVYSLLAPTAIEFAANEKYRSLTYSQKQSIENVYKSFNNGIISVNAYDPMKSNKDKYLYFRTDHHWTALGAYYAYTGFIQAAGTEPVPLEHYETGKVEGFLGSTYSATLNKRLQSNPDTIVYYKPFINHQYHIFYEGPMKMNLLDMSHAEQKNKYRIFLSGDRPWGRIVTEVENSKKILVIKDSYANAFVPFLLPHYKEIYVADPRQFKLNAVNFIKEKGIQEVLFLNYVPAANTKEFAELIVKIMNQVPLT